jgi:GntR family transcriptional regulator
MAVDIQIVTGSTTPIYWQIVDQVCKAVETGALVPGDALPSVRALAERLVVNPNTVARAYGDLVRDGVLDSQRGKGLYVAQRRQVFSDEERTRRLDQAIDVFLHEVRLLDLRPTDVLARLEQAMATTLAATGGRDE